jgi:hypothetical protein
MSFDKIKLSYLYHDKNRECSDCGVISKSVNKSVKYNKNLCIDCLKELIISSQNPSKDTE